ncbi:hypothetical protein KFL_014450020, partial [Klebsormidium nitens]
MDLVGVRLKSCWKVYPWVGPITCETVRRQGVAPEASAPIYFAGEATDGGAMDRREKKKLKEFYEAAAQAQEKQLVWEELDEVLRESDPQEEVVLKGKKKPGRKARDLHFDMVLKLMVGSCSVVELLVIGSYRV